MPQIKESLSDTVSEYRAGKQLLLGRIHTLTEQINSGKYSGAELKALVERRRGLYAMSWDIDRSIRLMTEYIICATKAKDERDVYSYAG
jgi:hypothetical protein